MVSSRIGYQVNVAIGADDSFYSADVWIHGLDAMNAQFFCAVANMIGDLGLVTVDNASMMGDSGSVDQFDPDEWTIEKRENGTTMVRRGSEVHIFPKK